MLGSCCYTGHLQGKKHNLGFDTSGCTKVGTKKFGERCQLQEECESLICTRFHPTKNKFGYCGAKCDSTACPSSPAGATCVFSVGPFKLCGWKCTPGSNSCPAGLQCVAYSGGHFCGASASTIPPVKCGNNKVEAGEACDGTDLRGQTCKSKGFAGGTLSCNACQFDTSNCTSSGSKPKYGQPCDSATGCEAGLICIQVQGATSHFCSSSCDNNAPCPTHPPNSACLLQTSKGKFCAWLCPGSIKCPAGLSCIKVHGSDICS